MKTHQRAGTTLALASLLLLTPAPSFAQSGGGEGGSTRPSAAQGAPGTVNRQGFSIVLLLGDTQAGGSEDSVPPAARRALADMKDFLPYRSYRLLDSQWTLCCTSNSSAITVLRGVDDQEYELELRASPEGQGRLSIRFVLREAADGAARKTSAGRSVRLDGDAAGQLARARDELARAQTERDRLRATRTATHPSVRTAESKIELARQRVIAAEQSAGDAAAGARQRYVVEEELFRLQREATDLSASVSRLRPRVAAGIGTQDDLRQAEQQLAAVEQRIAVLRESASGLPPGSFTARPVIDTSFRMDISETVVVGTSRLKGGNRALIALLTAVPAKGR